MQPSDSLPPSATAPVPLAMAYPDAGAGSVPIGPTTRAPAHVPCVGDDSPALRITGILSRRGEGLPGCWAVLFVRALVEHPAGYAPRLAHSRKRALWPSMYSRDLGIRGDDRFRGRSPTARTFACLRIADPISRVGARLATGSGGLTLSQAGFAPAGRQTKFHGSIAASNSL